MENTVTGAYICARFEQTDIETNHETKIRVELWGQVVKENTIFGFLIIKPNVIVRKEIKISLWEQKFLQFEEIEEKEIVAKAEEILKNFEEAEKLELDFDEAKSIRISRNSIVGVSHDLNIEIEYDY